VEQLDEELTEVRRRGWAIEMEELMSGEASLAAPIDDRRGVTVGAIAISARWSASASTGAPRSDMGVLRAPRPRGRSRAIWGAIPMVRR